MISDSGGKRKINWKEVEQYLKQYIGEVYEIMDSADIIYVGNDFADKDQAATYLWLPVSYLSRAVMQLLSTAPFLIFLFR